MLVFTYAILFLCCDSYADPNADPVANPVRSAWIARLEMLQNFHASYKKEEIFYPPSDTKNIEGSAFDGGTIHVMRGSQQFEEDFLFLAGRLRDDATLLKSAMPFEQPTRKIIAFTGERWEQLQFSSDAKPPLGGILEGPPNLPMYNIGIDYVVGLRIYGHGDFLEPQAFSNAVFKEDSDGVVIEMIDPKAPPSLHAVHMWFTDRKIGFAVKKYVYRVHDQDCVVVENSDFKPVDGTILPFKSKRTDFRKDESGKVEPRQETIISVNRYNLGDLQNTAERYEMVWPKGASVLDTRAKKSLRVDSESRTLSDKEILDAFAKKESNDKQAVKDAQDRINSVKANP
jgi:hypothetical protein